VRRWVVQLVAPFPGPFRQPLEDEVDDLLASRLLADD